MKIVWILLYVTALHLLWGVLLMFAESPSRALSLAYLDAHLGRTALSVMLILASVCSLFAAQQDMAHRLRGVLLLMPQQLLLTASSGSIIYAAAVRATPALQAADPALILASQGSVVLLTIFHALAIFWAFGGEEWISRRLHGI